jgi:hypothetical protein
LRHTYFLLSPADLGQHSRVTRADWAFWLSFFFHAGLPRVPRIDTCILPSFYVASINIIRIRLDVTLAYLKGKDVESGEAQERANSSGLALYA